MKTLIIAPHMDDEAISCGGLILRRGEMGGQVRVLAIHGRHYGFVGTVEQRRSDEAERDDFFAALGVLGVTRSGGHCLMVREGAPAEAGFYDLLGPIESELKSFQPDEAVIPSADDLNQDHRHLNHVCEIALRPINIGAVTKVLEFCALDGRVRAPNHFVTLTRSALDTKLRAINCYRRERRHLPSPRAPENVEAQARVWGAACGQEFAEAYVQTLGKE